MRKFVVQVWDASQLEHMGAEDVESIEPVLTVVALDESSMHKYLHTLENLIQMSDEGDVRENWIVTTDALREPDPADLRALAELFHDTVAENE